MSTVSNRPDDGQDPPASSIRLSPEVIAEGNRALDELNALFDDPPKLPPDDGDDDGDGDEPPTSRSPLGPLSRLAVILDNATWMVSLEDAADRDLTGRETITFLVLNDDEIATVRSTVGDALSDAASNIIGRLPRRRS